MSNSNQWRVRQPRQGEAAGIEIYAGIKYVCQMSRHPGEQDMAQANARRIVACVNACAGMGDPTAEIAELKRQRDELLAALEAFSNYIHAEQCSTDGPVHYSDGQLTALAVMARKAIAKAKGGSVNHFPDAAKMVAHEGWQLVPVEPTFEMVKAATHSAVGFGTRAAYQAMLAAAPKHEGGAA